MKGNSALVIKENKRKLLIRLFLTDSGHLRIIIRECLTIKPICLYDITIYKV